MKTYVIILTIFGFLLWMIWPADEVARRAEWGYAMYLKYCQQMDLSMRTFDTNGANVGGYKNLCYDQHGVVTYRITGRCWPSPTIAINDQRTGQKIEFTHESCEAS